MNAAVLVVPGSQGLARGIAEVLGVASSAARVHGCPDGESRLTLEGPLEGVTSDAVPHPTNGFSVRDELARAVRGFLAAGETGEQHGAR